MRMKLSTYKELRRNFKGLRNESAANYFERFAKYIAAVQAEWDGF